MENELTEMFSDDAEEIAAEPVPAPEIEQPVETPAETLESEPVADPAPEPVAAQPERPEPGFVPIAAMMDERDRRKALEAELAQFKQQRQAPDAPDPYDDPQGFAAHQQTLVQQAIIADRFERSHEDAVEKHGEDTVRGAIEWAQQRAAANPAFAAEYMSKTRPIQWIVQQHKREADLADYSKDPVAFARRILETHGQLSAPVAAAPAIPVAAPVQQAVPPVKVPRSLATQGSGPSDIREVATGALAAVDSVFPN